MAEGQFVDRIEPEALAHIEIGIPVLCLRIAEVAEVAVVLRRTKVGVGSDIQRMCVGVCGLELQALGKAPFETCLQRVVVGRSSGAEPINGGIENRAAVLRIRKGTRTWRTD